jgi:sec-independent protein translocase protein TatC
VEKEMHLIGHLEEMRKRLIFTAIYFLVALCAAFLYVRPIYGWLVRDLTHELALLGPSDIIWVYFSIAGIAAIALTMPVAGYHVWKFVQPAVSKDDQRGTIAYIPAIAFLFILGLSFGYFILHPMVLGFLTRLSEDFEMVYTAEKYFSFLFNLTVPFGFLFEMPVVVMFLTRLGLLNPTRLAKARKLSYFALTVTAVMITPPDIVSDILVIVPLFLLYEFSVTLSKFVYRKKLRLLAEVS